MTLTPAQLTALAAFQDFLKCPAEPVFLLRGYAGTGKTTLLKTLVQELGQRPANPHDKQGRRSLVQLLAPTGRAARVLATHTGYPATTVHKGIFAFNHLEPLQTEAGLAHKSFKFFYDLAPNTDPVGTVYVVDEASLLGDGFSESEFFRLGSGQLLTDLLHYVQPTPANGYKLLLVGDAAQLPPVTDAQSWALDATWLKQRLPAVAHLRDVELTEVVRQAAGSVILQNATDVRDAIRQGQFSSLRLKRHATDVRDVAPTRLLDDYRAEGGGPTDDQTIIITYSNKQAQRYNSQVREHFFPGQTSLAVGDRLLITQNNYLTPLQPLYNGDFALVQTVGKLVTRRVSIIVNATRVQVPLAWRRVQLAMLGMVNEAGQSLIVTRWVLDTFLHSPHRDLRPEETKALYVDAVMRWRDQSGKSEKHPDFKEFLQQDIYFHALRVKFGYAITCHKAQGGTWRTAFVDFSGFSGQSSALYFRWVYTAITRAAQRLYLLNEGGFEPWEKLKVFDPSTLATEQAVPLPPAVRAAQTEAFEELPELETQLAMASRPLPMRQLLRRVGGQLAPLAIIVTAVRAESYKETYELKRGVEAGEVTVDYGGDQLFRRARPSGSSSALTTEAVTCLNEPLSETALLTEPTFAADMPTGLSNFYERFTDLATPLGLSVLNIDMKPYTHTYTVQSEQGRAQLIIHYDGKGRLTNARLLKHSSAGIADQLHVLLNSL